MCLVVLQLVRASVEGDAKRSRLVHLHADTMATVGEVLNTVVREGRAVSVEEL